MSPKISRFARIIVKTKMKLYNTIAALAGAMLLLVALPAGAQNEQDKKFDVEKACEEQADKLERELGLEPWQTFYVDSTLKHDYGMLNAEMEALKASKVTNYTFYEDTRDKWLDRIDDSFKTIFNEEQWNKYLRSGAGKAIKTRQARREKMAKKAQKADEILK